MYTGSNWFYADEVAVSSQVNVANISANLSED